MPTGASVLDGSSACGLAGGGASGRASWRPAWGKCAKSGRLRESPSAEGGRGRRLRNCEHCRGRGGPRRR
eukprot:8385524-Alexandrium_andersonii.AAC.1